MGLYIVAKVGTFFTVGEAKITVAATRGRYVKVLIEAPETLRIGREKKIKPTGNSPKTKE